MVEPTIEGPTMGDIGETPKKKPVWPKVLGIGCVVVLVLLALGGFLMYLGYEKIKKMSVTAYSVEITKILEDETKAGLLTEKFELVKKITEDEKLTFSSFSILSVYFANISQDRKVTNEEVKKLNDLLDDIVAQDGDLDFEKYQEELNNF